jgi:hypothetical protein|tara:strand:- start:2110 stop:2310 length:201 start_codon:yes stop_codon:yes gene_type:complete
MDGLDVTKRCEKFTKFIFTRRERDISDVQPIPHLMAPSQAHFVHANQYDSKLLLLRNHLREGRQGK